MNYETCTGCNRHVRQSDVSCPFCAGTARVAVSKPRSYVGRVAAAVVAAASATTLAACYGMAPHDRMPNPTPMTSGSGTTSDTTPPITPIAPPPAK